MHPKIMNRAAATAELRKEQLLDSRENLIDGLETMEARLASIKDVDPMIASLMQVYEGARSVAVQLAPCLDQHELERWEQLVKIVDAANLLSQSKIGNFAERE